MIEKLQKIYGFVSDIANRFLHWMERGDLVPLLVIVSAFHYADILANHDQKLVAIALGLMVDLGHYRSVMIAVRYTGNKWFEIILRWGVAAILTAISLSYHLNFYDGNFSFSLPIPLLIASLAYFERKDGWRNRTGANDGGVKLDDAIAKMQTDLQDAKIELQNAIDELQTTINKLHSDDNMQNNSNETLQGAEAEFVECEECGDPVENKVGAMGAHARHHCKARKNGNGVKLNEK